ncbi:YdbC family protein [Streptomyces sp. NPDC059506]|uniref:YdbC family protein n=1 Tax=Streptomyces TaxID=1883 RepID=UPI000CC91E69|nr:YdbC family protein [Streptomyces sp. SCUT-3]PLW74544.1 DUF4937 domain-containing protein [Streptomyces sp. DJ]QMV21455.1 DUF4937 domain-containing protein [Streptomyces sp. SCUT-3]
MLVKWIRCTVQDRDGFDRGQRQWAGLRGEPGFLGQGGGWSRGTAGVAHVFAFWESREAYEDFMAHSHDRFAGPGADTHRPPDVRLFEHRTDVKVGFRARFEDADVLRVAHSRVRRERVEHFVLMQQKVWNPAMAGSPGMLRGVFAEGAGSEFLVLSLWDSANERAKYRPAGVERLRERAGTEDDVLSVAGDIVAVEQAWTV